MDEYWLDRAERKMEVGDKTTDELLSSMKTTYKNSLKDIEKEIQAFYGKYAYNNKLDLSEVQKRLNPAELKSAREEIKKYYELADPSKIGPKMAKDYRQELRLQSAKAYMSRLEELKINLKHMLIELGEKENKAFENGLKDIYEKNYSLTNYDLDKYQGFSTGFEGLNYKKVNQAINEKWLGENYSDRIWKNKDRLLNQLNTTFLQGVAQGQNPRKIAGTMAKNYGTAYYNCERLARTESAHIMGQATLQGYKDRGVTKEYEFVATLDNRTSEDCKHLDGKIFPVKQAQAGVNYPPMHPNCRSTTVPYFPKDEIDAMFEEATRVARDEDGKLYMVPADMTYMQWQKTISGQNKKSVNLVNNPVIENWVSFGNNISDEDKKELYEIIKSAGTVDGDVELWRTVSPKELGYEKIKDVRNNINELNGKIISPHGFMSTAKTQEGTFGFSGVQLKVVGIEKGVKGLDISKVSKKVNEQEVVFNSGIKYKIKSAKALFDEDGDPMGFDIQVIVVKK